MKELNSEKWSLLQIANEVDSWKQKYHITKMHDIVFQNRATLTNVFFTDESFHATSKGNPRGFSNIPLTVEQPDEIWSLWSDPDKQTIALRNYIILGDKLCYVVKTRAGKIVNAFSVVPSLVSKYRKGIPLLISK